MKRFIGNTGGDTPTPATRIGISTLRSRPAPPAEATVTVRPMEGGFLVEIHHAGDEGIFSKLFRSRAEVAAALWGVDAGVFPAALTLPPWEDS